MKPDSSEAGEWSEVMQWFGIRLIVIPLFVFAIRREPVFFLVVTGLILIWMGSKEK